MFILNLNHKICNEEEAPNTFLQLKKLKSKNIHRKQLWRLNDLNE